MTTESSELPEMYIEPNMGLEYSQVAEKVDPKFKSAVLSEEGMIRLFGSEDLYHDWMKELEGDGKNGIFQSTYKGELPFMGRYYEIGRKLGGTKLGLLPGAKFQIYGYAYDGRDVKEVLDMLSNPQKPEQAVEEAA